MNASPDTICWQHLLLLKDKEQLTRAILQGEQAGVKGFIITVDSPVTGLNRIFAGSDGLRPYLNSLGISYALIDEFSPQRQV